MLNSKYRDRLKRLLYHYRLVILNDETFEEKVSFKLNRLNVFLLLSFSATILISVTLVLVAFTGLREYIPGYSPTSLVIKATNLALRVDSLENKLNMDKEYIESLRRVLTGDLKMSQINIDSVLKTAKKEAPAHLHPRNQADSVLRDEVALEDKYNIPNDFELLKQFVLFKPVSGFVSDEHDSHKKHYGIDIACSEGSPIVSISDGIVIFAEWSIETGHSIMIDHDYGLVSIYKHCEKTYKSQGDSVKAGDVIGQAGRGGEHSTGSHLHFEIWNNGKSMNPRDYIGFN